MLQPCECGSSVNSGDNVALVREILRFADDRGLTERQGVFVRKHFVEKFDRNISRAAFWELLCE